MHYVDGDYNGAQPSRPSRHIHLSDNDVDLMWRLFDYASLSIMQAQPCQMSDRANANEPDSLLFQNDFQASAADGSISPQENAESNIGDAFVPTMPAYSYDTSLEDWTLLGEQWLADNLLFSGAFDRGQT